MLCEELRLRAGFFVESEGDMESREAESGGVREEKLNAREQCKAEGEEDTIAIVIPLLCCNEALDNGCFPI